jgi:hypothetical protein
MAIIPSSSEMASLFSGGSGAETAKHPSTVNPGGQAPKKQNLSLFKRPLKPTTPSLTKNPKGDTMYLRTLLYEQALSGETCKTTWGIRLL